VGTIEGSFGKSGKYKVYFKDGVAPAAEGGEAIRLFLRFKRYVFDDKGNKKMAQD
jgi:selenocysteine-specific elongation factor